MASTVVNGPSTPMIPRGKGVNLGTLPVGTTNAVQFTISQLHDTQNGFDNIIIITVGGTVGTPILEVSIDGGVTWAAVTAAGASTSGTQLTTSTFASDTAASSANSYLVSGLQGLGLFRFGAAITVAPAVIWGACS